MLVWTCSTQKLNKPLTGWNTELQFSQPQCWDEKKPTHGMGWTRDLLEGIRNSLRQRQIKVGMDLEFWFQTRVHLFIVSNKLKTHVESMYILKKVCRKCYSVCDTPRQLCLGSCGEGQSWCSWADSRRRHGMGRRVQSGTWPSPAAGVGRCCPLLLSSVQLCSSICFPLELLLRKPATRHEWSHEFAGWLAPLSLSLPAYGLSE